MMGIILTLLLLTTAGAASNTKMQCVGLENLFADRVADSSKHLTERTDLKVVSLNANDLFVYRPLPLKRSFIQENPAPEVVKAKEAAKVEELIRALEDIKPDVLVLQEVVGTHSSHILDPKHQYIHITGTPKDFRGLHTAFLIRADLNVDVQLVVPTLNTRHAKFHRGLPYIKLRQKDVNGKVDRSNPPDLIVMGVHLRPYRNKDGMARFVTVKNEEIHEVIRLVKELEAKFPDSGLMVVGDWNADMNVRPEIIPLKFHLQDVLDFSSQPKDRHARGSQTFHTPTLTELAQLDAIMMNLVSLQHLVASYVYRYRNSHGELKQYKDSAGNTVNYPTTYEARSLNGSDHHPIVSVLDMTTRVARAFTDTVKTQQKIHSLQREIDRAAPFVGMNDKLTFKIELQGERALFLQWLQSTKLNADIHVLDMQGNTIYIQATVTGVGYLILKDSENPSSWMKTLHFQAPQVGVSAASGL